jgi:hypothetical protein
LAPLKRLIFQAPGLKEPALLAANPGGNTHVLDMSRYVPTPGISTMMA